MAEISQAQSWALWSIIKATRYLLDAHLNSDNRYMSVVQGEFRGIIFQCGPKSALKDVQEFNQRQAVEEVKKAFELIGAAGVFELTQEISDLFVVKGEEDGN